MPIKEAPQSNTQHAVPQNIMDVEFRLIGDLTMRQFFYILIFFGISYGLYISNFPFIIKWPSLIISAFLGLGFAFLPIEDRGLDEWIINFLKAIYSQNQMVWRKSPKPPSAFLYENISMVTQELITLTPTSSRRKLEQYLQDQTTKLTAEDPFEKLEESFVLKVREAFDSFPQPQTAVAVEEPIVEEVVAPTQAPAPTTNTASPQTTVTTTTVTTTPEQQPQVKLEPTEAKVTPKPKLIQKLKPTKPKKTSSVFVRPITPDRHSGRKFTSLLPSQGSIVLPIRGEKVIPTVDETQQQEDAMVKVAQLKAFMDQIKEQKNIKLEATPVEVEKAVESPKTSGLDKEAQELISKMQEENEKLTAQIEILKEKGTPQNITQLVQEQKQTTENISKLKEQVSSLGFKQAETPTVQNTNPQALPENLMPQQPNVIAGIVRDPQGQTLTGVLIVIRNNKNEPIRAVKTNNLGQFFISSPVTNGNYTIQADINGTSGVTFDIISVEAKGEIIPALEFIGK